MLLRIPIVSFLITIGRKIDLNSNGKSNALVRLVRRCYWIFDLTGGFIGDPFFVEVADFFAVLEEDFEVAGLSWVFLRVQNMRLKCEMLRPVTCPRWLWSDPMI